MTPHHTENILEESNCCSATILGETICSNCKDGCVTIREAIKTEIQDRLLSDDINSELLAEDLIDIINKYLK